MIRRALPAAETARRDELSPNLRPFGPGRRPRKRAGPLRLPLRAAETAH